MKEFQILAHRGHHNCDLNQKNSIKSLLTSIRKGFSVETDIRDFNGQIYISHDPVTSPELTLEDFFKDINSLDLQKIKLALNIKSDGLSEMAYQLINKYLSKFSNNIYFFDGSVPETLSYFKYELSIYTRCSEYEIQPLFKDMNSGYWIDNFTGAFDQVTAAHKIIDVEPDADCVIVSPELHRRPKDYLWNSLRTSQLFDNQSCFLCTDYPDEAILFFNK